MYENLKKAVKAGDELVKIGESVAADGELNLMDVQHLPKVAGPVMDLYEAFKNKDLILEELKEFLATKLDELKE